MISRKLTAGLAGVACTVFCGCFTAGLLTSGSRQLTSEAPVPGPTRAHAAEPTSSPSAASALPEPAQPSYAARTHVKPRTQRDERRHARARERHL